MLSFIAPLKKTEKAVEPVAETTERDIVPLEASVLLIADEGLAMGAAMWVADGELFVATDDRLPLGTDVDVVIALPEHEETVRLGGDISFWHETDKPSEIDRNGMGIAITPVQ